MQIRWKDDTDDLFRHAPETCYASCRLQVYCQSHHTAVSTNTGTRHVRIKKVHTGGWVYRMIHCIAALSYLGSLLMLSGGIPIASLSDSNLDVKLLGKVSNVMQMRVVGS